MILPLHGIGGAKDLPIPLDLAISGAVAALVLSFAVLAFAWREPRYEGPRAGREVPGLQRIVDSTAFRVACRGFGLLVFGWAMVAAIVGENLLINPFFGMFYVYLWVAVVPLSVLFGRFYRAVSPVRTIHGLFALVSRSDPERGLFDYPARLGYWPAALGLFAFVWFELVYHSSTELGPVRLWFTMYVALMLMGGALFGTRFFERADPFEVYSTLAGHLSVFGRRDDETLVVRSPLANLAAYQAAPGLVAVVAVLFGSTAFDSFSESTPWLRFTQDRLTSAYLLDNVALIVFCVGVGLLFAGACALTGVGPDTPRRDLPMLFAHSIAPIIVGYIAAHYLTFLIEQGQMTLMYMSDPLSQGSDLLGTGDLKVNYWLSYHPRLLATLKVLGVVIGHVLAVVAAHDRAIALLPKRHQLTGQLPMLFVMVGFTVGGLYLLFAA